MIQAINIRFSLYKYIILVIVIKHVIFFHCVISYAALIYLFIHSSASEHDAI